MKDDKKWSKLAVEAHVLARELGYEAEPELNGKSDQAYVLAWRDFMIDNRDDPSFILRVNNADNLPALLKWCLAVQGALSIG
jgi:hypothetical protein